MSTDAEPHDFLDLEPTLRQHVVVLPDADLQRLRDPDKFKRVAKKAIGAGGGAAGGAVVGFQLVARGAVALAAGTLAVPLTVAGGVAGFGVAWALDRGTGLPPGVRLIDAETAEAIATPEGPLQQRVLYDLHPARHDLYVPDSQYKRFMLQERAREAEDYFLHCGACRIELTVESGEEVNLGGSVGLSEPRGAYRAHGQAQRTTSSSRRSVIEAPGSPKPGRLRSDQWLWANVETDWADVRQKRIDRNIKNHQLVTTFKDDRKLSGDVRARVAELASIDVGASQEKLETTKWVWDITFPS